MLLFGCIRINNEDPLLIACTVVLQTNDGYTSRIALIDYNSGDLVKYVTDGNDNAKKAHFSPDRKKLLIEFSMGGTPSKFGVYFLEPDSLSVFSMNGYDDQIYYVIGNTPVWNANSDGFYYSNNYRNIYYYDLDTQNRTIIHDDDDNDVYCLDLLSNDSLIVFSNKYYRENNDSNCTYIMSSTGEYLSQVVNPHIKLINVNGINVKAAYYLNWNSTKRQFLYSAVDSSYDGYRISTTDYCGLYKKEYTDSFYDKQPIWGPENIVFFHRTNEEYDEDEAYVLDTKKRSIAKLSEKIQISRAVFYSDPTY